MTSDHPQVFITTADHPQVFITTAALSFVLATASAAAETIADTDLEAASESGFTPTLIEDTVKETHFNLFRTDEALKVEE